jgi:hypothetical protein
MHTRRALCLPHPFQLCHQGVQIFQCRLCHTQSEGCQTPGRRRGLSFTFGFHPALLGFSSVGAAVPRPDISRTTTLT